MRWNLLIMVLAMVMCCINLSAQTKKSIKRTTSVQTKNTISRFRQLGQDGYVWYKVKKGNLFGAQDLYGQEILPVKFSDLYYSCDEKSGLSCFHGIQGDYEGCYSKNGECIISPDKRYTWIRQVSMPQNRMCWEIHTGDHQEGIADARGNVVIPPIYYAVILEESPVCFRVLKNSFYGEQGICDLDGKVVVNPIYYACHLSKNKLSYQLKENGRWSEIPIEFNSETKFDYSPQIGVSGKHFVKLYDGECRTKEGPSYYIKDENGYEMVFDANQNVIIPSSKKFKNIYSVGKVGALICWKVTIDDISSKDIKWGLVDKKGNEIAPIEFSKVEYATGELIKFKINDAWGLINSSGKILVPSSRGYSSIGEFIKSQRTFPYTMYGYKGEIDITGKELSRIQVPTSNQSNTPSNNSVNGTTTVVVEHHRDPMPVQEWHACIGCGGMGTMGCDFCGSSGTRYVGDNLRRCSRCNGRGIIPCNVCYGNKGQYVTVYK